MLMSRHGLFMAGFMIGITGSAFGLGRIEEGDAARVLYTITYTEHCFQVDDLLRETCARIGQHLPEKNKRHCNLPAQSFRTRTADPYLAFKSSFGAEIRKDDAAISKSLSMTRNSFERQFAEIRAGRISMLDFELLARELEEKCSVIETEWLTKNRKS